MDNNHHSPGNQVSEASSLQARPKVMIVEDDANQLKQYASELRRLGIEVVSCHSCEADDDAFHGFTAKFETLAELKNLVDSHKPDLVLTDFHLAGDIDGMQVVELIRELNPQMPIILHSAALNKGFIIPWQTEELENYAKMSQGANIVLAKEDTAGRTAALSTLLGAQRLSADKDAIGVSR